LRRWRGGSGSGAVESYLLVRPEGEECKEDFSEKRCNRLKFIPSASRVTEKRDVT
jgi:hypothetical protein